MEIPKSIKEGVLKAQQIEISKTSKVWISGLGGGALAIAGGMLLCTGVGTGAGAVMISSGLAAIGGVVGGGMFTGIGVIAAGSATAAAISSAIAHKLIKDPELIKITEKLAEANQLLEAAKHATETHVKEIEELNRKVGELLREKKTDRSNSEELKARLIVLIKDMQSAAE